MLQLNTELLILYRIIEYLMQCTISFLFLINVFALRPFKDVDEFGSSSEQIWRSLVLHHLFTKGSFAVNGCRQNESPNS